MLAKEVLAPIDLSCVRQGRILGIERGHAEHLAGALAVARGDDGRVHIDEAALLEEAVDGRRCDGADAEDGTEEVRARAQVLLRAQELDGGALLLQRIAGVGDALDHNLGRGARRAGAHRGSA